MSDKTGRLYGVACSVVSMLLNASRTLEPPLRSDLQATVNTPETTPVALRGELMVAGEEDSVSM
jgi:hypothetical protein